MRTSAPRSLLWIDDDVEGVALGARLLALEGVSVEVAANGRDGLRKASESPYSLILLDLHLPDGSGLDILQALATRGVSTPVVLVTGYASLPIAVRAVRLGATDVQSKPFFADDALRLLDRYGFGGSTETDLTPVNAENAESDLLATLRALAISQPHLALPQTARRSGIGRHQIEKIVRRQTGLCWRDWRRRVLMEHAASVMDSTDEPLKALAQRFGYSAIQSFSRAFTQVHGMPPGRYRDAPRAARAADNHNSTNGPRMAAPPTYSGRPTRS